MKKQLFALILAITMLLPFAACADSSDNGDGTGNAGGSDSVGVDDDSTNFEKALAALGSFDVSGREFKILSPDAGNHFYGYSGSAENEVYYEEPSDEALPNAIYKRNLEVSEKLGIDIVPVWGGSTDNIKDIVRTNYTANDTEQFDVVLSRLDHEITFAANGMLRNFYDISTMNLEHGWWDEQIVDTFTINGDILYTLSGDINYYDDYAVQIMFFNKQLAAEIGAGDLYQMVRDGSWTIDKMYELACKAAYDNNGDGQFTPGVDIMGLGDNYDAVPHYMFCYGQKMSDNDADGMPQVVWPNDINTAVLDDIYSIFSNKEAVSTSMNAGQFMDDTFLFYGEMLGMIPNFREMTTDFGILPMPKGDASMERYCAYVSNGWTTAYCIPIIASDEEANNFGIILECLSASSADLVTPALYDQLLESKYIRDEQSKEMLTYILDSKVYDWAGDLEWASSLRSAYQNVLNDGPASFTTSVNGSKKMLERQLEKLCENLTDVK